MIEPGKTTVFLLHHDSCRPRDWTVEQWEALARYAETGDVRQAARLARKGLQLLQVSPVPAQQAAVSIGWTKSPEDGEFFDTLDDLSDGSEPFEAFQIFAGPPCFVSPFPVGGSDGEFDGYEYEIFGTLAEAEKHHAQIRDDEDAA